MSPKPRIAVGLSGGVDSAVAAALLLRQGWEVVGVTMRIWSGKHPVDPEAESGGGRHACYGPGEEEDIAECVRLAASLGIEYRVLDLAAEYEEVVLGYFRREYLAGRTPNPCVVCNRELKFGFLVERARAAGLGFECFATGHYARTGLREGIPHLRRARFEAKDQSYFIHSLEGPTLSSLRFPLGELTKEEVRKEARELGLEVADKPESQDFIAGGDYAPLFADAPPPPGDIVDAEGRVIGRHRGLPYYTVGQRRGIGVSTGGEALYVLRLDAAANRVVVGPGGGLFSEALRAEACSFRDPRLAAGPFHAFARIRQNHRPAPCLVRPGEGGSCLVEFERAERAVAPGQSVVVYDAEGWVLGGGLIAEALPSPLGAGSD